MFHIIYDISSVRVEPQLQLLQDISNTSSPWQKFWSPYVAATYRCLVTHTNLQKIFLQENLVKFSSAKQARCSFKNSLESCIFNMKATFEDEKLQGKINKDKQDLTSVKLSAGLIRTRLQRRRNLNIRRKSWKMSAALSLSSCTRVQEACQEEYLGLPLVVEFLHLGMPLLGPPL